MINNKPTFLLSLKSKEEVDALNNLVFIITGKHLEAVERSYFDFDPYKAGLVDIHQSIFLEISYDLLEAQVKTLTGYISHTYYPSNRRFKNDTFKFIEWYKEEYYPMKDYEIIKHIPHTSLEFPKEFKEGGIFGLDAKYITKMADIGVDQLFKNVKGIEIKAEYSRLFCDVEKYKDDSKEPMSKFGQGYIYEKMYDGKDIIRFGEVNGINFHKYVNKYYDNHHKKIYKAVQSIITRGKKALILDIHSYSDEQAKYLGLEGPFPDICIGINDKYVDQKILSLVIKKIVEKGYTYKINFPYSGSIIPSNAEQEISENNLCSIMLEINKRIYL